MATVNLTAARVRELLSYDPNTGVFTWRTTRNNYARSGEIACARNRAYHCVRIDSRLYRAHRLAWLYVYGEWPTDHIDHINGDKADNRIANLRTVGQAINLQNQRRARADNISGLLGAEQNGKRWAARIKVHGKRIYLGTFDTPEEAHEVYITAKRRLHEGCTI